MAIAYGAFSCTAPGVPMRTFSLAVTPKPMRKKIAIATQKTGLRSWYRISNPVIPKKVFMSGRAAERRQGREIDVLEPTLDGLEAFGLLVREDVDDRVAGEQPRRDHLVLGLIFLELVMTDGLAPHLAARRSDEIERLALELQPAVGEHRH